MYADDTPRYGKCVQRRVFNNEDLKASILELTVGRKLSNQSFDIDLQEGVGCGGYLGSINLKPFLAQIIFLCWGNQACTAAAQFWNLEVGGKYQIRQR